MKVHLGNGQLRWKKKNSIMKPIKYLFLSELSVIYYTLIYNF